MAASITCVGTPHSRTHNIYTQSESESESRYNTQRQGAIFIPHGSRRAQPASQSRRDHQCGMSMHRDAHLHYNTVINSHRPPCIEDRSAPESLPAESRLLRSEFADTGRTPIRPFSGPAYPHRSLRGQSPLLTGCRVRCLPACLLTRILHQQDRTFVIVKSGRASTPCYSASGCLCASTSHT